MKFSISKEWITKMVEEVGDPPSCPHGIMIGCRICAGESAATALLTEPQKAWRAAYIARFVEKGFPEEWGIADFEAGLGSPSVEFDDDPKDAADEAMSYYDGE